GVTAYTKQSDYDKDRLRLLAEAIAPLEAFADMNHKLLDNAAGYTSGQAFETLIENGCFMYPKEPEYLPKNIPAEYTEIQVQPVVIKGHALTRLYFPVVSKRHGGETVDALIEFLQTTYGRDLISVKTKTAL